MGIIKFEVDIPDFENELQALRPIIDNLKGRRDCYLAHSDKEYFTDSFQVEKDYPLSFEDAEKLIKYADLFCNRMLSYLAHEVFYCKSRNANDLVELLSHVIKNGD